MIVARSFSQENAGVFGLARSGISAVRSLLAAGARVQAWDDSAERRDAAARLGAHVVPHTEWKWDALSALVLSPGVPLTHPEPHDAVKAARNAGVEVIGDIELFAREVRPQPDGKGLARIVAITGTNGKSTTTALIGHILSAAGFDAQIGGNIGKPVLDLAKPGARTIYVLEVSSYQIDLSPGLTPDVSVLTNISPDHIDRHGSLEGYAAVKARLMTQTAQDGLRCVGVDDPLSAAIHTSLAGRGSNVAVSAGKVLGRGVFVIDNRLYDAQSGSPREVMDLRDAAALPGTHNWQNAALAYAAVKPFVSDARAIAAAIRSFPGLPHRLESVAEAGGLKCINDSKATNADAAARALATYDNVLWIAGGRPKEGGIESLIPYFSRVRKAYLIGEAAQMFAVTLEGRVAYQHCGTLEHAVDAAIRDAEHSGGDEPVILLSPACASFDQFRDFEARGDAFREYVLARTQALKVAS